MNKLLIFEGKFNNNMVMLNQNNTKFHLKNINIVFAFGK